MPLSRDVISGSPANHSGTEIDENPSRRNCIISGLSSGVLVVEASENSGTRVTARCAAEQNRDLYAVPGNVTAKNSWTPNTLIKQGAKLVGSWEDVWEDLPSQVRLELEREAGGESKPEAGASLLADPVLRPEESIVLHELRTDESVQIDELLEKVETQLTSSEVFTALFELEISGRVRCLLEKTMCACFEFGDSRAKFRGRTIPRGTADFRNFAHNNGRRFAFTKSEGEWKRGYLPC